MDDTIIKYDPTEVELSALRRILIKLIRDDYGMVLIKHVAEACEYAECTDASVDEVVDDLIDRLREEEVLGPRE